MIYFQCCKTTDLTTVGLSVDCVLPSVQFVIIKILLVQDPSYPPGRARSKEEERQAKGLRLLASELTDNDLLRSLQL